MTQIPEVTPGSDRSTVGQVASEATDAARTGAGDIAATAKDQAREVVGEARAQARTVAADARDRITEQARNQYVLGYQSTNKLTGVLPVVRTIEVKGRDPNWKITHRKGYTQVP